MPIQKKQFVIDGGGNKRWGYVFTPADYDTNPELCALLIWFHGAGDAGDGTDNPTFLNKLYNNGSPLDIANKGNKMAFKNPITGKETRFIVISIQGLNVAGSGWCLYPKEMAYVMTNDILKNYKINKNIVACWGLSAGGEVVMETLSTAGCMEPYCCGIPMSAAATLNNGGLQAMKSLGIKVWGFHGDQDATCSWNITNESQKAYNAINSGYFRFTSIDANSPLAKYGCRQHAGWASIMNPVDPNYRENFVNQADGKTYSANAFEYTLMCEKGGGYVPAPIAAPLPAIKADAGPDQTVLTNKLVLDPSNSINAVSGWFEVVTRPAGAGNPSYADGRSDMGTDPVTGKLLTKQINDLADGIWEFKLTAQNKYSQRDTDNVTITVNTKAPVPPVNIPPVINAGADAVIQLPVDNIILNGGNSTDADGTIVKYLWAKVSGPACAIAAPDAVSTVVTGLVAGDYIFSLTGTDNKNATVTDQVSVKVLAAAPNVSRTIKKVTIEFSDGQLQVIQP